MAKNETPSNLVKVNGRTYREMPDGKLAPVFDAAEHASRILVGIGKTSVVQGVRIVDSSDPDAPALTVNFDEAESASVLETVKAVLEGRQSAAAEA